MRARADAEGGTEPHVATLSRLSLSLGFYLSLTCSLLLSRVGGTCEVWIAANPSDGIGFG